MKKLYIFFSLLLLASCATPTAQLPNTSHYGNHEKKQVRKMMSREARKYNQDLAHRVYSLHYDIIKSTGENLCDKKLVPDIGIIYVKLNRYKGNPLFGVQSKEEKEYEEDLSEIYNQNRQDIFIYLVLKGSAADKAGIQAGDKLLSLYGIPAPSGEDAVVDLAKQIQRSSVDGLNVDVEIERRGKPMKFSLKPDMICPYPLFLDEQSRMMNAFADGENIYVTLDMVDYISDDSELAAIISHELAHNTLGHVQSSAINSSMGIFFGALSDVFLGTADATSVGEDYGNKIYSKDFEFEADYFSVYYMARAGYDYKKVKDVQKKLVNRSLPSLYTKGDTHPLPQERYVLMEETAKEIDLKKAFSEDLEPNFKEKNPFLSEKR